MAPDEKGERFILSRTQESLMGEASSTGVQTYELTRMAIGLDLIYLDSKGTEHKSWGSGEGEDLERLPTMVRVRLTLQDSSGQKRAFVTTIRPELAEGSQQRAP